MVFAISSAWLRYCVSNLVSHVTQAPARLKPTLELDQAPRRLEDGQHRLLDDTLGLALTADRVDEEEYLAERGGYWRACVNRS